MTTLSRFDPPAFMDDLDRIPGGAEAWDTFMDTVFDWAIKQQVELVTPVEPEGEGTVQFFSPKKPPSQAPIIEQAVRGMPSRRSYSSDSEGHVP
jgi:hypothetical protein